MKKRILSIILALAMLLSLLPNVSLQAAATGTLEDPAITVTTSDPVDNGDGTTTVTTTTDSFATGANENGDLVVREITQVEITTTNSNGDTVSESWSEFGTESTTSTKTEDVVEITVDLTPALTPEEGADSTTITESSETVDPVVTPNEDGTTTVTETPREVEVTVNEIQIHEDSDLGGEYETSKDIGLSPIQPEWTGEEQDTHLYKDPMKPNGEAPEGFDLYYSNYGEDSEFGVKLEKKDEEGNVLETDYSDVIQFELTDTSSQKIVTDENGAPVQATDEEGNLLFDENGEPVYETEALIHTGYCVDLSTGTKSGYWYEIENLEEAGYYSEEDAAHIRAIALNGYWGTEPTEDDPTPTGSLAAFKQMLKDAGEDVTGLTDEEIDGLTEGQAGTATQLAIWMYGNQIKGEFDLSASDYNGGNSTAESEENALKREQIDKIAAYLSGMSIEKEEAGTTEIINSEKFVDSMSITVGEMVEDHSNNEDEDDDNDAYNVDLTFSLVVTPTANDDLIVKVVNGDGEVIKTARIAGSKQENEDYDQIAADENGNYTLTGLELIEGANATFNLKLEGAQYLEQGVYIYKSQAVNNATSQTFVGIAEGYRSVDVAMEFDMTFDVKEATVTTEIKWERSGDPSYDYGGDDPDPYDGDKPIPDEPTPEEDDEPTPEEDDEPTPKKNKEQPETQTDPTNLTNLADEEVPLADVPGTGDTTLLWFALSILAAAALILLNRKKEQV